MAKIIAKIVTKDCVACGCCIKVCPKNAIRIPKGVCAEVDTAHCIGCGKCRVACPATAIVMEVRDEQP